MSLFRFPSILFFVLLTTQALSQDISGQLQKWHTITLTYTGPQTSETDQNNPFLNYRLNVTFISPSGKEFVVPGFYAADGNAAETGAASGNKWQARFTPNETGTWNYSTSFRTGTNIAISLNESEGNPSHFDGASGNFNISQSDKGLPDNRARGRLGYVGERYLKFEQTNEYFLKAGADSPENLLAYGEFDNTPNSKTWQPHVNDWSTGDVVWRGSKGKGIIGAINYLASKGMNAFSFLTMNVIGDGKDVWPWAATSHDALNEHTATEIGNRKRYDVSKLDQWELLFSHADTKGMFLHFKTQETENDRLLDDGALGVQRKLYYRELIARFGHHLALNWNLGEEHDLYQPELVKAYASYIRDLDPYDHHIVIHSYPDKQDTLYGPLLGPDTEMTGASLQIHIEDIHTDVKRWLLASKNANKQWVVANDEQGDHQRGVTADADYSGNKGVQGDNRDEVRHKALWGTLMAGGTGVEYYFGYETGETDLTAEDWRSRDSKWEDAKIALEFFREYLPYWKMDTADELTSVSGAYGFAETGEIYALYLPNGGSPDLDLSGYSSDFKIHWFNPATGGELQLGSKSVIKGGDVINLGNPPNNPDTDWVVLVRRSNDGGTGGGTCDFDYEEDQGLVVIEAEKLPLAEGWRKGTAKAGYSGEGYLEWIGANHFNTPGKGTISTTIKINTPGTYQFQWRSIIGAGNDNTEHNDTWLRFPDASDYYAKKANGSVVYPHGSGKTPNPNGAGSNNWFKVYMNSLSWHWMTYTSDHDAHEIFVEFNEPGIYTMEISGRSVHHMIDRIILHKDHGDPRNLSHQETKCKDTNTTVPVEGVEVDPKQKTLEKGETIQLSVNVLPANATNKKVTWSSSNPAVATVDGTGMVQAVAEGNTQITVTSEDGGHQDVSTISVTDTQEPPPPPPPPPPSPEVDTCTGRFVEKDGRVIIEAENLQVASGWTIENTIEGFSDEGYLQWQGGNRFEEPGHGKMEVKIEITTPGTYNFQWRSKVGEGTDSTESNDSWLRFPDAHDFYAMKGDGASIVYPKGSGKTPNPEGAGADGWFKVYSSGTVDWTWATHTYDGNGHEIYVVFDEPGIYTMEISGRSEHHLIDRIVLYQANVSARDLTLPESSCSTEDPLPEESIELTIEDASAEEGGELQFVTSLNEAADGVIRVQFEVVPGTASHEDYIVQDSILTFNPGETSKVLKVQTIRDGKGERDETLALKVAQVLDGTLSDSSDTAEGLILDVDNPLVLYPNPARPNSSIHLKNAPEGDYEISVYTTSGELVQRKMSTLADEKEFEIGNLHSGIYIFHLKNVKKTSYAKLIVE